MFNVIFIFVLLFCGFALFIKLPFDIITGAGLNSRKENVHILGTIILYGIFILGIYYWTTIGRDVFYGVQPDRWSIIYIMCMPPWVYFFSPKHYFSGCKSYIEEQKKVKKFRLIKRAITTVVYVGFTIALYKEWHYIN